MSKKPIRRENGMGTVFKHGNHWAGRIRAGTKPDGKPNFVYFSGKSEFDVKKQIREYLAQGQQIPSKMSVADYIEDWVHTYKKGTLKKSSYDRLENTLIHQIKPNFSYITMDKLTPQIVQSVLAKIKNEGMSYSTVKKTYDCLNAAFKFAVANDDIPKNPMLLVEKPSKNQFEQKEIRFFTEDEAKRISEECLVHCDNGNLKYGYGDVYILMLNTGLRMGEVLGLRKSDVNFKKKTLHVQRNTQSVLKRDENGKRIGGRELITNSTKTYTGDRILPLNASATAALHRLFSRFPKKPNVVYTTRGTPATPERLERTFYRILDNVGIERTGTHSLRHTFASVLFDSKVDVKTISKMLGHASIQITLNTYVHLMEEVDHSAVAVLDKKYG